VRFWDTSAIIPLLSDEDTTDTMKVLLGYDPRIVIWAFTPIEVASALWRKQRARRDDVSRVAAERRLAALAATWTYVNDFETVLRQAHETVARHALKAADALQLAAALVRRTGHPSSLPFVSLDRDLIVAARTEGFTVLP
jgi:predicted nucleic acid-binding protein